MVEGKVMKKKLWFLLVFVFFTSCMNLPKYSYTPFINQTVGAGEEKVAGIGDSFFEHSEGQTVTEPTYLPSGTVSSGFKYDLTVVELNKEKLSLQYNEFTYQPQARYADSMFIIGGGDWLIKQGFNKRFDYALSDKIVRFRGYEFEVLAVEDGQITYRRLK